MDVNDQAGGEEPEHVDRVGELLARHLPGLRAFVRLRAGRVIRAREASVDLVQSVCREILERADQFRHGDEPGFRQWLYTTALRKIANRSRYYQAARRDIGRERKRDARASSQSDSDLLSCYHTLCSPSQELSDREEIDRFETAFDQLPEDYRELIIMARLLGLSRDQIAERTGRTPGAVSTALSRALSRLAHLVDQKPSGT